MSNVLTGIGHGIKVGVEDIGKIAEDVITIGGKVIKVISELKALSPATVSSTPPGGNAGGDLSGTYPDPTVAQVNGAAVPKSAPVVGTNGNGQLVAGPTSLPPNGTAGGDLSGTYPNPAVAQVEGAAIPTSAVYVGTNSLGQFVTAPLACALSGCTMSGTLNGQTGSFTSIGNGAVIATSTNHSSVFPMEVFDSATTSNNFIGALFGLQNAVNDAGTLQFNNVGGLGSALNTISVGVDGSANLVTIGSTGAESVPGGVSGTSAATLTLGPTSVVGTGATIACSTSHTCDQFSGDIKLVTGTSVGSVGNLLTVTFPVLRSTAPNCTIFVFDESDGEAVPNVDTTPITTSSLTYFLPLGGSTLVASSTYHITYVCGGI